jgi:Fur family transcriptional regulator, ferric uptake regulator
MAGNKDIIRKLEEYCIQNNIKITGQRKRISEVMQTCSDHPDVESVYKRAKKLDEKISIATVYRTINLLEEAQIIEKHDFGDGKSRYEMILEEHHDHLIDIKSREIIEFYDEELEKLKIKVAKNLGYELVGHRLELYAKPLKTK